MLGLTGYSSDLRDIIAKEEEGDHRAKVALDVFVSRIHKYIGSYTARMKGVDAIIFTAGVGENSAIIRERVLEILNTWAYTSMQNAITYSVRKHSSTSHILQ